MSVTVYEQDVPVVIFIAYEDEQWIETVNVKNADSTPYSFTGATGQLIADSTRPRTSTADLDISTSDDITLSSGAVLIDTAHGLSPGEYEFDFFITVSAKTFLMFKGEIKVKANV